MSFPGIWRCALPKYIAHDLSEPGSAKLTRDIMLSPPRRWRFAMRMLDLPTAHISCLRIIPLGCLNGCMAEKHLDLLRLATRRSAQFSRAPKRGP
jgi:hypothetical protein